MQPNCAGASSVWTGSECVSISQAGLTRSCCTTADGDDSPWCADCDDSDGSVYPGASEVCDGVGNDCDTPSWPTEPDVSDDDGDGFAECDDDCDDADPETYPGAPEICDLTANDCLSPAWPTLPPTEDHDLDGSCDDDCAPHDPGTYPGATEQCNGRDDDCSGFIDDGPGCDGTCDDAEPIGSPVTASYEALAWTGQEYGAVWSQGSETYFTTLSREGEPTLPGLLVASDVVELRLLWTGSEFGLAWLDGDPGTVWLQRITPSGELIDSPTAYWNGSAGLWDLIWARDSYVRGNVAWTCDPFCWTQVFVDGVQLTTLEDCDGQITSLRLGWNGSVVGAAFTTNVAYTYVDVGFVAEGSDGVTIRPADESGPKKITAVSPSEDGFRFSVAGVGWIYNYPCSWTSADGALTCPLFLCSDDFTLGWSGEEFGYACDSTFFRESDQVPLGQVGSARQLLWNGEEWTLLTDSAFVRIGCNCEDADLDGATSCNDCNDASSGVFPGAPQICDGMNNDCSDPLWPQLPPSEADEDGDLVSVCDGDCDDGSASTYPAAPQICDGVNNDCSDAAWPAVPAEESDGDADSFLPCQGDCNDDDPTINPATTETCNNIDDNCNNLIDEDDLGEDTDTDGIHNSCDNCREAVNPGQDDTDQDSFGDACDNCIFTWNDQADFDDDDRGDLCDNCRESFNPPQDDFELDGVGDACDNCFDTPNPSQSDRDDDFEGDHCDLDDDLIYMTFELENQARWQEELGYLTWNAYRGDLSVLVSTGEYTQLPGSNPLAGQQCALDDAFWAGVGVPSPSRVAFFLATGNNMQGESGLGTDSSGTVRINSVPCP